jgi:recombination protein U
MVRHTNEAYKRKGMALIDKIPTEWQIVRGAKGQIINAFPVRKSSVDFVGLAEAFPIAFDCKSTKNKTRFPLSNIESHQIEWLKRWKRQGGLSFFLVHFQQLNKTYFLDLNILMDFTKRESRASIPLAFFEDSCPVISQKGIFIVDYLQTAKTFNYERG